MRAERTYQQNINAEKEGVGKPIPSNLDTLKQRLIQMSDESSDFVLKKIPLDRNPTVLIACIEGLADKELLDRDIIGSVTATQGQVSWIMSREPVHLVTVFF